MFILIKRQRVFVFLSLALLVGVAWVSFSQTFEVNVDELNQGTSTGQDLEFVDYQGNYTSIDSLDAITGIGVNLGQQLGSTSGQADLSNKYQVQRVIDANSNLNNADIFILEAGSSVDSISNMRRILKGYLKTAFSYDDQRAEFLAHLITVYNAVYRGELKFFQGRYVPSVMNMVSQDNVGLARVYSQWPGQTRMLIPLRSTLAQGAAGGVNVSELATPRVVQQLSQENQSSNLKELQKVVNAEEKVNKQEQSAIASAQDSLAAKKVSASQKSAEQAKIDAAQKNLNAQETQLDASRTNVETALKASAAKDQKAPAKDQAAAKDQKASAKDQAAAKDQKAPAKDQAAAKDQKAPAKDQAAAKDQKAPAKDQAAAKDQAKSATASGSSSETLGAEALFIVRSSASGTREGSLVAFNSKQNNTVMKTLDGETLLRDSLVLRSSDIVALSKSSDGVYLKSFDKKTLQVLETSAQKVSPDSAFLSDGRAVYVVVEKDGSWYVARFGNKLTDLVLSEKAVLPYTGLVLSGGKLYVESSEGNILALNPQSLK